MKSKMMRLSEDTHQRLTELKEKEGFPDFDEVIKYLLWRTGRR